MNSTNDFFWDLLGRCDEGVEIKSADIEFDLDDRKMSPKHLMRRKSSKRFVIGDEGDEDFKIPDIEVTSSDDQPLMNSVQSSSNLLMPQRTLK